MTTGTAAMTGGDNPQEAAFELSRDEQIKQRRREGAAKARAMRQAQLEEQKATGIVPKKKSQRADEWFEVFKILMMNRDVRVVKDVPTVMAETDLIIEMLEDEDKL